MKPGEGGRCVATSNILFILLTTYLRAYLPIYVFITWLKTVTENLSNMDNFKGALPLFCDPILFRSLTQQGESNSNGANKGGRLLIKGFLR